MKSSFSIINKLLLSLLAVVIFTAPANAADDEATELARQTQNPISDLISVPFEINANFRAGPDNKVLNVLNIKPVITANREADSSDRCTVPTGVVLAR